MTRYLFRRHSGICRGSHAFTRGQSAAYGDSGFTSNAVLQI